MIAVNVDLVKIGLLPRFVIRGPGAGKWVELSHEYARTGGACMLSSWPERARAMYVIGGFAIVLCTVPQNRTSQNFSAIYSKRKCTVLCSSSPNSPPIAAVPKVPTYVWLPLGHVNPSLGEIMPPSLSCAKYCN